MNCFFHGIEDFQIEHANTFLGYSHVPCGCGRNYACKNSDLIYKDYRLL